MYGKENLMEEKRNSENSATENEMESENGFTKCFKGIADFTEAVVCAVVFAILLLTIVFRMGYVSGDSMYDTLKDGERYLLSNLFYEPKAGDIVVFAPDSTIQTADPLWVKRVIATAGQEVYIDPDNGSVFIDGIKLDESNYVYSFTSPRTTANPITVPEGCVFLMGDNRLHSKDCRDIGCVDKRRIIGHLILKVPGITKKSR